MHQRTKGLIQALLCAAAILSVTSAIAAPNPLEAKHEFYLASARKSAESATSSEDKLRALNRIAAELDSLGRSREALTEVDRALAISDASNSTDLVATKGGILFSLNDPAAAANVLEPKLAAARKAVVEHPEKRVSVLDEYLECFVTATFSYIQLERWKDAVATLADAETIGDPDFSAYRSLVYRFIMARAKDPSIANVELERRAAEDQRNNQGHYGALLRLWDGQDSIKAVAKIIGGMRGADQQEAFGEALFYGAAYAKFVRGDDAGARQMLDNLNALAPYGSIEWIYGRRVLQ